MGDFAEGDVVFKLGDVVSKWKVLCDGSGGEPCNSLMSMWMNDVLKTAWKAVHVPSEGGVSARAFLVKVDAQIVADPSFIKDKAKAMFLSSES